MGWKEMSQEKPHISIENVTSLVIEFVFYCSVFPGYGIAAELNP